MNRVDVIGKIVISLLIAGLGSSVVIIILILVLGNIYGIESVENHINLVGGVVFGIIFGYRLKSIVSINS